MSRSAADATRFTSTGPYAQSKSSSSWRNSSKIPYKLPDYLIPSEKKKSNNSGRSELEKNNNTSNSNSNSSSYQGHGQGQQRGGGQESAREKVERLRAQARAARVAQSSSRIDRFITVGRGFANKAHKVAIYSLLGASGMFLSSPSSLFYCCPCIH